MRETSSTILRTYCDVNERQALLWDERHRSGEALHRGGMMERAGLVLPYPTATRR